MFSACLQKKWVVWFIVVGVLGWCEQAQAQFLPEFEPQASRLKDIGTVQTLQEVQLIGYGLVVGLEGFGQSHAQHGCRS
jgi:flagellar basal body P-ring protein FlgI